MKTPGREMTARAMREKQYQLSDAITTLILNQKHALAMFLPTEKAHFGGH